MGSVYPQVADPNATEYCFDNELPEVVKVFSGAFAHHAARLIKDCFNRVLPSAVVTLLY
jgi:hypothetical protein